MWNRAAAVACVFLLGGCTGSTGAGRAAEESPAERSIQARWWEWAAAESEETNPVADETGEHCARNQPGDVWFLAGTFGGRVERRCTVPLGVPVVVPAVNLVATEAWDCFAFMTEASGVVELDGAEVPLERFDEEPITFVAGVGNPVTGVGGSTEGAGCGLWARIDPLGAGEHRVSIHGTSGSLEVEAEYTLTVAASSGSAA
ncbi:hypothetical protein GCM10010112_88650 [Actinoplanes lobatus]|uniref:Lipoprotein n=1 Tax=Actinoplanes lobatus TaxID=113568 RepID=A0A7W7MM78_9ACTN|nr:hypothetical protein [Actinoplanes lobatus]MBB4754905.1 hypothetical protein [Actinoplanes lobatus]GGN96910.1 hypothetical protein GCM10010112_88650 [Actinoplanes lobatus]GIE44562.1 hypothetical protein Alo02nite_74600 [Actinoplanes lobatus]